MNASPRFPDFDALVRLHQQDPRAFEDTRRAMLRSVVDDAPEEHRAALEELLERIEAARDEAESPEDAAQGAFRMMCESVDRLREAWDSARYATAELQAAIVIEQARAKGIMRH